jgi:3-hydroxyisobutyrate dehydrogenase-like beta-hydroxyacid dehydrogenase
MCRSVVIKGLEALVLESLLAARHFGVESAVIDSLRDGLGRREEGFANYLLSRPLVHGRRRAEEMREVSRTLREAGLQPRMSEGCAQWQDWAAGKSPGAADRPIVQILDELRASLRREVA